MKASGGKLNDKTHAGRAKCDQIQHSLTFLRGRRRQVWPHRLGPPGLGGNRNWRHQAGIKKKTGGITVDYRA